MLADFQALGVTIEPGTFDQVQGQEEAFEVWAINWQAVTGFLTIETQWRVTGTPVGLCWLGIDYTAAAAALRGRSQRRFQRLLADLRIMEAAALPILNNVRSPDGNNVRSPDGNNVRSPDGNNVRSPDGNNVRSPDGNNVRSPDGNNVRSPDGNNVRSPDGNNVRSPDGNRGTA